METMAGGASPPPNRCALVAELIEALSKPLWECTAFITFTRNVTKRRFSRALSPPGDSRLTPVSVPRLQLLCLPDPLTPLNGFS